MQRQYFDDEEPDFDDIPDWGSSISPFDVARIREMREHEMLVTRFLSDHASAQ